MNLRNLVITGDLTINTPGAHVTGAASTSVGGSTNVTAVSNTSFVSQATHTGGIVVTDSDGATIDLSGNASNAVVELNTTGPITLAGTFSQPVTITKKATVTVEGTVSEIVVNAADVKVTNNGTVTKVTANENVSVVGTKPVATEGTGTVTEAANDDQLTEIQNGTRLVGVANGVNIDNIAFLSKRVNTANKGKSKVAQVHLNKENLIAAYASGNVTEAKKEASDLGTGKYVKTYENGELFIGYPTTGSLVEVDTPVYDHSTLPTGTLTIDLSIEGDDLLLGNTTMSVDLFKAIKSDESTSYQITVIKEYDNIEKLRFAKIEFNLVDGEVVAKLINS